MEGKFCIVTGANAGIGLETARGLASKGATVGLVCRNAQKGEAAKKEIVDSTGNTKIQVFTCDLGSQASIRDCAAKITESFEKLDVLVNNAGAFFTDLGYSPEKIERQFAINHMAYFYMTKLLMPLLEKANGARVVCVSSNANYNGKIYFKNLYGDKGSKPYHGFKAYAQSKLANILFAKELGRRAADKNITANALHPGVVRTHIGNKHSSGFYNFIWKIMKPFMITTEKGARTSLYLATSPEVEGVTGKYFDKCKEKKPNPLAEDNALAQQLWELSESLIVE